MKAFFNYISWLFFGRTVKLKLRKGALQGLRLYVNAVSGARKVSMFAVLGIMGLAAITCGVFMLIGGLLWLANLNPQAYPWIMVITGALLTLAGVIGYLYAFRQKLWVELSQINEFTQAALSKLPHDERPANPAVTGMWNLAAKARIHEQERMTNDIQAPSTWLPPGAAEPANASTPKLETPRAGYPTAASRPAVRIEPSINPAMHPAT